MAAGFLPSPRYPVLRAPPSATEAVTSVETKIKEKQFGNNSEPQRKHVEAKMLGNASEKKGRVGMEWNEKVIEWNYFTK